MDRKPKMVFIDIETAPTLGYYFDLWKEGNIVAEMKSWYILSFAYKVNDGPVKVVGLNDYKSYKKDKTDDYNLMYDLHTVLNEADIIVAHNGDKFDIKKINARLVFHGFSPPIPYKTIDTLKVAKKHFAFNSNRLDSLGQYLGVGQKLTHTGFSLWKGCMEGDTASWNLMKKYNKQDVVLLEQVYMKLRHWMTTHPNLNIYEDRGNCCPICQSNKLQKRGFRITATGKKQAYQCLNCGGWSQGETIKTQVKIR